MNLDPNAAGFKTAEDDIFARIAARYDKLCDVFSFGIHRLWKNSISNQIANSHTGLAVDLASGTGDIPFRIAKLNPGLTLLITDICEPMLAIAESKLGSVKNETEFALMDAHNLVGIPDQTADVVSISFGMKICNRDLIMAEALRVLKPGGSFYCLEASQIPNPFLHKAYLTYMSWCLPLISRILTGGDPSTYSYLLQGIYDFPNQARFTYELEAAGFSSVSHKNLTFGIVAIHHGKKPTVDA